jgi:thiamine biosynthesis lipoprotein
VPASELLRTAVTAGLWAAERSGGLVDPTLLGELEAAGYETTRRDAKPAQLGEALTAAPPRRPAAANPASRWREIRVLPERGAIERPLGVRFDTGGSGKGLAADALAQRLDGYAGVAIDCGGDIRLAGRRPSDPPFDVGVAHPLSGTIVHHLALGGGGVATSGLDVNVWRCEDGSYAHHLIDPATGEPAWTGVISATAVAPSALEAETLAKAAILSGPRGARALLADHGGVLFFDDGAFDIVAGRTPAVVRLPRPRAKVTV